MKKLMVGILVVIPIIILLIVAMVSTILSVQAWVAVEDMSVSLKNGEESLTLNFSELNGGVHSFYDYIDVEVYPQKANRYTIEWQIADDLICTDTDYADRYDNYLQNKGLNEDDDPDNDIPVEYPAAMLVDADSIQVDFNSSGDFIINSYCNFTVIVQAENVRKSFTVYVKGYDVESVSLSSMTGTELTVGESALISATYTPIDSIVDNVSWASSDGQVATVDDNGVVTAKGEGEADITMSTVRKDGVTITSAPIRINVNAGASDIYGNRLVTSASSLTFAQLGIEGSDIDFALSTDISRTADGIEITGQSAVVKRTDGRELTVEKCAPNDIVIVNHSFFSHESGYVLAVGEDPLVLRAGWADMMREGSPEGVVWRTSDSSVATVENGRVIAVGSGIATVEATLGECTVSFDLNVRNKVTTMKLATSQTALAVGLAQQTVFSSDRFVSVEDGTVEANYTDILIQGAPRRDKYASDSEFAEATELFYEAYDFRITEGGEFAHFDQNIVNRLVFDSALEGRGRQSITVKVSAKYPKYAAMTKFTEETVVITAVYGVSASSREEFEAATRLQKAYYEARLIPEEDIYSVVNPEDSMEYLVTNAAYSQTNYALVLTDNFKFGEDYIPNDDTYQYVYGDVYGNNHMISASGTIGYLPDENDYTGRYGLINVVNSNVTISNIVLRPNELTGDSIADSYDPLGIKGACLVITASEVRHRLLNVRVEYSIMENGKWAVRVQNSDVDLTGCILRNLSSCSIYARSTVEYEEAVGDTASHMSYCNLNVHNCVCSNSLGTFMSFAYERVTVKPDGGANRFSKNNEANRRFFEENFYNKGYNSSFIQTGFLDIYNWQKSSDGNLIDTGDETYNGIVKSIAKPLIELNSAFAQGRVWYDDQWYFHLGFITSGISLGESILDEPRYLNVQMEDDRFYCIHSEDVKPETNDGMETLGAVTIGALGLDFYGYRSDSNIQPGQTYEINLNFISHLHS